VRRIKKEEGEKVMKQISKLQERERERERVGF
jgi:hypothetical protein